MCRLVGVVVNQETDFRLSLREAPRSLATLSREHPHGWGVAVYDARTGWSLTRNTACAVEDARFHETAAGSRGEMLIGHIRRRTVGPISVENTHPFQQGRWVFAHNGTINALEFLEDNTSPERRAQVRGQTDSELFFAFLLTRLDEAVPVEGASHGATDEVLTRTMREVTSVHAFGACNFLLSDGEVLYAFRWGRTLYLLEREPRDAVRTERESLETGAVLETPWTQSRRAVLVASEALTDEPWHEIAEGALVRVERGAEPAWRLVTG
jgi:glutamine amidotransferase